MVEKTVRIKFCYVKMYDEPPINRREILRYAGAKEPSFETDALLDECLAEIQGKLAYRVCFTEIPLLSDGDFLDLGFIKTNSRDLKKNLMYCDSFVLFAATVGIEIDRLISRYSRVSPAKALIFQAIGAERIESLADLFCREVAEKITAEGKYTRSRFSPGYGDFPLSCQKEIFACLDCARKIGLTLNSSYLMSPSKSVTAIIGISSCDKDNNSTCSCESCSKTNCTFRRTL